MAELVSDERARSVLKNELERRGIGYRDLARRLNRMGLPISAQEVTDTITAGDFPASFMVQCFEAMDAPVIHLDF